MTGIPKKPNPSKPTGSPWINRGYQPSHPQNEGYQPSQGTGTPKPPRGGSGVPTKPVQK